MNLIKILQKKSKDFIKNQKSEDKAQKAIDERMEKQDKEDKRMFELMETSGYNKLFNKIKEEIPNEGLKKSQILNKVLEQIGTFDPNKDYHEKKTRMKTKIVDNSKAIKRRKIENLLNENNDKLNIQIPRFIDNIISGIEEKIPKKTKKPIKKKTMTTTKPIKKTTMKTAKIMEYKPKNISEEKPKGHELDKVIKMLGELKQTTEIMNAIKYVKNFIKKELSNK